MTATQIEEWIKSARASVGPRAVAEGHVPSANERNNLVHLCFRQFYDHSFRPADLAVIELTASDIRDLADLKARYVPAVADMLWDHWMGEPETPTREMVVEICQIMADLLFTMDEKTRNDIEVVSE